MNETSGVATVSIGISPLVLLVIVAALALGAWKIGKILWALFGSPH